MKQYFWYLCGTCERVIRSYGKEKAAREFILKWWTDMKEKYDMDIILEIRDTVLPMTYREHLKYKKIKEPLPDFVGLKNEKILFNIEMKTGSRDITSMSAFQLDVSDCKDIIGFMERAEYRFPTFIFHVQVIENYRPPTSRNVALNAWWASVYELENNIQKVNMRRLERRPAFYFSRQVFKPLDEFPSYILSEHFEKERDVIKKRLPKLV